MGFFSWHTTDTDEPIWNVHTGKNKTVYMIDNKGNSWKEEEYDGYGEFGGKDYFELLAEMNGLESCRSQGIALVHHEPPKPYFAPNFVTSPKTRWRYAIPRDHAEQGFFDVDE